MASFGEAADRFLTGIAGDSSRGRRFIARNFLLEEGSPQSG